jgi:putative flippase GtrA
METEKDTPSFLQKYIIPKVKFGLGSLFSTCLDYAIFFGLLWANLGLEIGALQAIALSISIASNFIIQRNLIFQKIRGLASSLRWSISFSLISIMLSSIFAQWLTSFPFFNNHPLFIKLLITAVFFLFNYYTKQYSFEHRVRL